jgi:signal transduction histidine kinase
VHAIGLPAEVKAALDQLPLDAPVPLAEVARTGEPLFLASVDDLRRYPDWGAAMIRAGSGAAAIVPVWANGELRGVLGLAWPEPRVFDQDERAFVLTLGVMCAQAIMRSHLRAAELTARQEAEEANRSKAHFVATISHELRTPMNAVLGYTELLADEIYGPVSALQKDHLGRVQASGAHLLALIEDLLGYARIEAGEEVLRAEPVFVADIIEQSLLLIRPLAEKKGLHVQVNGVTEPAELHTDSRKVCQILVNLLANAVKFTDTGGVVLGWTIDEEESGNMIRFDITDTGRGVSPTDQEHIFEPFWQAGPLTPHPAGTTGLGLSVARQLARLLGGDVIIARGALGNGCTFVASLPTHMSDKGSPEEVGASPLEPAGH